MFLQLFSYHFDLCRSIDTKKAYRPPADVRDRIEKIARDVLDISLTSDWESTSLSDAKIKFKVSLECSLSVWHAKLFLHSSHIYSTFAWQLTVKMYAHVYIEPLLGAVDHIHNTAYSSISLHTSALP